MHMLIADLLIANLGIQTISFSLSINAQGKFKMWHREWCDTTKGLRCLAPSMNCAQKMDAFTTIAEAA